VRNNMSVENNNEEDVGNEIIVETEVRTTSSRAAFRRSTPVI